MLELILALILALTGVAHTPDPALQAIAERRAAQITADFSHTGATTAEVIAWNTHLDPATSATGAVNQWVASPPHLAILSEPSLTRIWCAGATGTDPTGSFPATYWACVLAPGSSPDTSSERSPAPAPTPAPEPLRMLPNTAVSPPGG
jgi:hypothetical protein